MPSVDPLDAFDLDVFRPPIKARLQSAEVKSRSAKFPKVPKILDLMDEIRVWSNTQERSLLIGRLGRRERKALALEIIVDQADCQREGIRTHYQPYQQKPLNDVNDMVYA